MKWLALLALFLFPLTAFALGPKEACIQRGQDAEKTCVVSLSTLIARGEDFDGKTVLVTGFYAYAEVPMLFASRDAYLASDAADGVEIKLPSPGRLAQNLASADHRYVRIVGRYHAIAGDVSGYGGLRTGGVINELSAAGDAGDSPWGYSAPMPYDIRKKGSGDADARAPSAASPPHCVKDHGAWCVLEGVDEESLDAAPGFSAFRLSKPSLPEAALIVIAPTSCFRRAADQLSMLSFDHAQHRYDLDWEKLGVRLRADGKCDLQILLPESSSNPSEWAFGDGLDLLRTCRSDQCDGAPISDLMPQLISRHRQAALPTSRPPSTK